MALRFGLLLSAPTSTRVPPEQSVREARELVLLADQLGLDTVMMGQHFLSTELRYPQPVPFLAHMQALAPRLRVGTGITLLPLLHPVDVAESMATLDILTGGKAIFGVGIGYAPLEFDAFGIDRRTRTARFEESLSIIRSLWSGEPLQHRGRFWSLDGPGTATLPIQPGGPPVWMAGQTEPAVRRAARIGDTWYVPPFPTHADLRSLRAIHLEEREKAGRPPEVEFPVRRETFLAPTRKKGFELARHFAKGRLETYLKWGMRTDDVSKDFVNFEDDAMLSRFLVGPPDECAAALADFKETLGMTTFVIRVQWPDLPHAESMQQLTMFGEQVMPLLAHL